MKIYIASSWKNQHAVEMLTALLRECKHEVASFVENEHNQGCKNSESFYSENGEKIPFDKWIYSENGSKSFTFDTENAANCDLCIYISPSGKDAAAEVGISYGNNKPIIGLYAKGEDFGLMRRLVMNWFNNYRDLLANVELIASNPKKTLEHKNPFACFGRAPHRMDFDDMSSFLERLDKYNEWNFENGITNDRL